MLRLTWSTLVVAALLAMLMFHPPPATAAPADRIVVVGGALTEIVHALGDGGRVVGVDTGSRWPAEAAALPRVGYQRALAAEGVLSLMPDLVLVNDAAGPATVLQQIRDAGVRVEVVAADDSLAGLLSRVHDVGRLLSREAEGERLAGRLEREMAALAERVARFEQRPRVAFLLSVGRGSNLAGGRETAADAAIRLAGGHNALAAYEGYKPLNAEAMIAAAPDVLLTTQRSLEQVGGVEGLLDLPGVALTPAARSARIEAMDALLLLGFGPRTPSALAELASRLHRVPVELAGRAGRAGQR
jgi:iron complex transport system substrate-binding protein